MKNIYKKVLVAALAFMLGGCAGTKDKAPDAYEAPETETAPEEGTAAADVSKPEPQLKKETAADETDADKNADSAVTEISKDKPGADKAEPDEDYELKEINIVVDAGFSFGNEKKTEDFAAAWEEAVAEKTGREITISINAPDKNAYVEEVARLLDSGRPGDEGYPDAVVMSRSQYYAYRQAGYLWDMSKAYDNAAFKSRLLDNDVNIQDRDENGRQYGFMPVYGNGCITYVKASWFALYAKNTDGIDSIEDIDTFDKYMDMLGYFSEGRNSGVIAAGFLNDEEPYIDTLPEFWQDAYPAFYLKDGVWTDGFTQQAAIDALDRIAAAYKDGIIDKDTQEADSKAAREKFFNVNPSISGMAFTYWAGEWARTLTDCMTKFGVDDELEDERLLMLPPIKEIEEGHGGYLRREAPVWVIIDDGDNSSAREKAVFEALFETMLDGEDIQKLWMKSAKNVHWDNVIAPFEEDEEKRDLLAEKSRDFFLENSAEAPVTAALDMKDADVKKLVNGRNRLIADVAAGKKSGEEAVAEYIKLYGEISDAILEELNTP